MDELWNSFVQSGKVEDYLKYREQNRELTDENQNKGLDNKRTDSGRE